MFSASAGLATIFGSAVGGTLAGAVGIHGMFAASAAVALAGTVVLGYAVLGPRAGIGPARSQPEVVPSTSALGGPDLLG
jgi:hypothetical protein